jgi:hypothetical protein
MARWQRDPRVRRQVSRLVAAAEILALTVCFGFIFLAYCRFLTARLGLWKGGADLPLYIALAATAVALGVAVYEGLKYLRGVRWARLAFVAENAILLALGILWFVWHYFWQGERVSMEAAWYGAVLPVLTLFPLLWPLIAFSPDES